MIDDSDSPAIFEPTEPSVPSVATGLEVLRDTLKHLGMQPGVYRMLDAKGQVLYVGKAKHLKNRVANYVNLTQLPLRLQRMVMKTARLEVIITRSEAEALLVESNLIKEYKPPYNILLRDDKSYPYIMFTGDHPYPRITKYRGAQQQPGDYFGPFVSASAVNDMMKLLQKAFLLRPCSDYVFKNRSRPCLQYQIKRCSAPCVGYIPEAEYAGLAAQAKRFLKGEANDIREEFVRQMQQASEALDYEQAALLRDRLKAITHIQQQHDSRMATLRDADIVTLVREGGQVCIQLFSYRAGSNFGSHTSFPSNTEDLPDSEVIELFIARYYQRFPTPRQLLLSHAPAQMEVLEQALHMMGGYKVEVLVPQRGEKWEAMRLALDNTTDALQRHMAGNAQQRVLLEQVANVFGLEAPPQRIEVYDNSHISGSYSVGGMIVATPEGFDKASYRIYNIRSTELTPGDDYAMLREVLTRRFKRMQTPEGQPHKPDVILIDGGQGQLSAALAVCEELGVMDVPLVAIAKGPDRNAGKEWFFMPGREPFQLPVNDATLHYLQRLRDEVHRFAIGAHRNQRSRAIVRSELDSMPGIGAKRKKALLQHFGSVRAIRGAGVDEIAKVEGISAALAQQIWDWLH